MYLDNFRQLVLAVRRDLKVSPAQLPVIVSPIEFKYIQREVTGRGNKGRRGRRGGPNKSAAKASTLVAPPYIDQVNAALQVVACA